MKFELNLDAEYDNASKEEIDKVLKFLGGYSEQVELDEGSCTLHYVNLNDFEELDLFVNKVSALHGWFKTSVSIEVDPPTIYI